MIAVVSEVNTQQEKTPEERLSC